MKNSFLTTTLVPILGTVITAFQVTREAWACYVFIFAAIIYTCYLVRLKTKLTRQTIIAGVICISLMATTSISGLICSWFQQSRNEKWLNALRIDDDPEFQHLVQQSEQNDGPSQMKLSDYYYGINDFKHSRDYAQMAADNGNTKGYDRLIELDYLGLGGKKNYKRAFSNIIKAQKLGYSQYSIDDERFLEQLSELELSTLKETAQQQVRFNDIEDELAEAINRNGKMMDARNVFEKYHDELYSLSLNGFLPASECLFLESWLLDDTERAKEYASQLYSAGRLPIYPTLRHHLLTYIERGGDYRISDYVRHIYDNDYLFMTNFEEEEDQETRCFYSDTLLIQEHQLFKAQYRWYLGLNNSDIDKIEYVVNTEADLQILLAISKILLERNIKAIKMRAGHLGEIDPAKQITDIEMRGFKTHFQ